MQDCLQSIFTELFNWISSLQDSEIKEIDQIALVIDNIECSFEKAAKMKLIDLSNNLVGNKKIQIVKRVKALTSVG